MANFRLSNRARDAAARALRDAIDAGGGPGSLAFYTGPQPANAETAPSGQMLGTLTLSSPCAEEPQNGMLVFAPIAEEPSAAVTGKAAWARFSDSDGAAIWDCDVTGIDGGGTLEINTADIVKGGPIRVSAFTIIVPAG